MFRGKSIACSKDRITASSSKSNADNHDSLGAYQEQAQALTYDPSSLSAMPQHQRGSLHRKYETQWKNNLSM